MILKLYHLKGLNLIQCNRILWPLLIISTHAHNILKSVMIMHTLYLHRENTYLEKIKNAYF